VPLPVTQETQEIVDHFKPVEWTPEYSVDHAVAQRCYNAKNQPLFGARGTRKEQAANRRKPIKAVIP